MTQDQRAFLEKFYKGRTILYSNASGSRRKAYEVLTVSPILQIQNQDNEVLSIDSAADLRPSLKAGDLCLCLLDHRDVARGYRLMTYQGAGSGKIEGTWVDCPSRYSTADKKYQIFELIPVTLQQLSQWCANGTLIQGQMSVQIPSQPPGTARVYHLG
jgi:hypothetical protein